MSTIVFLINSLEGGGAERAMSNLLRWMEPRLDGHDVHLVLLDSLPEVQAVPSYVTRHTLDARGNLGRSGQQLWRLLRDITPDTCLSFLSRSNVLNAIYGRLLGYRAIISERVQTTSHFSGAKNAAAMKLLIRRTYPLARQIIAVSEGVSDDLVANFGIPAALLTAIPNPIARHDLEEKAARPGAFFSDRPYIVAMGRLVTNKNFSMLIDAYAAANPEPDLVILGEGPDRASLEEQIRRLGLNGRVCLPGFFENPYPILSQALFLVSTSRAEGFPNTLVEAMCLGLPIIATDCPVGPAEVLGKLESASSDPLRSAKFGMLVQMDDLTTLTKAVAALTRDADLRQEFRKRAIQRAEHFDVQTVLNAYTDVLGL